MGTHPIFESDFDCLTEMELMSKKYKIPFGSSAKFSPSGNRIVIFDNLSATLYHDDMREIKKINKNQGVKDVAVSNDFIYILDNNGRISQISVENELICYFEEKTEDGIELQINHDASLLTSN